MYDVQTVMKVSWDRVGYFLKGFYLAVGSVLIHIWMLLDCQSFSFMAQIPELGHYRGLNLHLYGEFYKGRNVDPVIRLPSEVFHQSFNTNCLFWSKSTI